MTMKDADVKRRSFLIMTAGGIAALAGCSQQQGSGETDSEETTEPSTSTSTVTATSASTPMETTEQSTEMETTEPSTKTTSSGMQPARKAETWLEDVGNYDGTVVDARGTADIMVMVGADGNGGSFAFDPAVIRVDSGATVAWQWTGNGGGHNIKAKEGAFDSGSAVSEAGVNFEHTFESTGIYRYYCAPHRSLGMKGVVIVGDDYSVGSTSKEYQQSTDTPTETATETPTETATDSYDGYRDDTSDSTARQ